MMLDRYAVKTAEDVMVFEFTSVGPKGRIVKLIQYTEIYPNVYNLGFGDKDALSGNVDDTVVTNNGDSKKVLATVAFTVYEFTDKHPSAWVYATGSSASRTRLYRIGITNFFDEMSTDFDIYGFRNGKIEEFESRIDYEGFFVRRK